MNPFGKYPLQGLTCSLCGSLTSSIDQIGYGLGLCQIHSPIEKGALGEFARTCQSRTQLKSQLQQMIQYDRAAMALQFDHIFTGIRMRG